MIIILLLNNTIYLIIDSNIAISFFNYIVIFYRTFRENICTGLQFIKVDFTYSQYFFLSKTSDYSLLYHLSKKINHYYRGLEPNYFEAYILIYLNNILSSYNNISII